MAEYIERNGLLEWAREFYPNEKVFASAVINAPTADVQEVRHGKWIYDPNGMDFNIGAWVCSECKQRNNNLPCNQRCNPDNFVGSNFCPHCGAKMDKERENND